MIFQLIYTCALSTSVTEDCLAEIARDSAERNAARGLTGILMCQEGSVLQVLEGEKGEVEALFAKIETDSRIRNIIVLIRRQSATREFPDWSMGYRNADETGRAFALDAKSLPKAMPDNTSPELRTISRTFARVNGLAPA